MTLLCKAIIVAKSKEVKTRWSERNLAESSVEGCDLKRVVLLRMMLMMMMMTATIIHHSVSVFVYSDGPGIVEVGVCSG
jgi:hypothetical protein